LIVSCAALSADNPTFCNAAPIGVANSLNDCADNHTAIADSLPKSCIILDHSQNTTFTALIDSHNELALSIVNDIQAEIAPNANAQADAILAKFS
jgi:hypothetical protein